ncbi:PH domain-containing protein [Pullulanibacillus camelliae]|uniref:PH domain-containing protein n=1 Tax=Pullulanibacillus camelliae TaxID=1707096 RepID=UPI001E44BCED|nr:PH domain-containing protein [Pullulanibacillus camelliae]
MADLLRSLYPLQRLFTCEGRPIQKSYPLSHTISKISPSSNIFSGYRLLSSRTALEITYDAALLGSVKISPKERALFLKKLKKRCPHASFLENETKH